MTKQYLKPAPGLTLPLPDGRTWPAEGEWVDVDQYVRRRIADGDLVAGTPPSVSDQAPAEDPATTTKKGK
ncbi:DUF2635 domain-containing protein [Kaistia dalseonensis]|uniref:DUF2635 domain-containing protein n=1 Tax=Kaistia dalseonensis TaxID=410840 RepID=A0ABU0HDD8_9HYPH|nr:DUF2635 domain-containing protein [Kaistia dalseonensis]MCX5497325.1 DUF2635 domain-containing protein [Kaistia dalseonensis]MDQ0439962.1 hypothetical protein [Kaistia dalseonensis]